MHANMRWKIIKIYSKYAPKSWNMRWKIFEKWPKHSQKFTSGNNSSIFSQIQLINQNFGKLKFFSRRIRILEIFFKRAKNFEKYIAKISKCAKKHNSCIKIQKCQNMRWFVSAYEIRADNFWTKHPREPKMCFLCVLFYYISGKKHFREKNMQLHVLQGPKDYLQVYLPKFQNE